MDCVLGERILLILFLLSPMIRELEGEGQLHPANMGGGESYEDDMCSWGVSTSFVPLSSTSGKINVEEEADDCDREKD